MRASLVDEYPGLRIRGVVGDFDRHLPELPLAEGPRLVAFLGGTIGNFAPTARARFLRAVADVLHAEDQLQVGTDLVKSQAVLEAAYNDSQGVTAEFNRNILRVINREFGGDFRVDRFQHVAFYDRRRHWIEMRLRALGAMRVKIDALELEVRFADGEELRTEISAKFTGERLERELADAAVRLEASYTDREGLYALSLARVSRLGPDAGTSA